jgi:hypothetical protein
MSCVPSVMRLDPFLTGRCLVLIGKWFVLNGRCIVLIGKWFLLNGRFMVLIGKYLVFFCKCLP